MQYDDDKKEKLEKLERKLYSRNAPDIINAAESAPNEGGDPANEGQGSVKEGWENLKNSSFDELASKVAHMAHKKQNFVRRIFVFSVLFFTVAAGVAAFIFLGGANMVSSKNVDIKVVGPLSVGSGQENSFDIKVINNNNASLESASLLVEYPQGSRSPQDLSKELTQERFPVDTIKPGKSFSQNIKVVFFGDKGSSKEVKISLEYKVQGSSALFYKEKTTDISISSAPVIITPTYPKEVNSGQEMSLSLEVASNSQDKIDTFLINVEYPFGFVLGSASPKPSFGNNVWQISNLSPGEKQNIVIRGSIIGQDSEERVFKITSGTPSDRDERAIGVTFSELTEAVLVQKPFVGLGVSVNGQSGDAAGQGGKDSSVSIAVQNNIPSKLYNVSVEAALKGAAFDGSSVRPSDGGFFQSANNTILWDNRSVSSFSGMSPGDRDELSFTLTPLSSSQIPSGSKPEIQIVVTVKGERILDSGSAETVTASETRKISLVSSLALSSKTVRSLGSIENSGPIPPQAGTPTTYTIIWSISNSVNQVSNVQVKATLPSYIKWTGIKSPSSEIISYNESAKEIVWNAGSLLPSGQKNVSFQLEFLPSTSQLGQSVPLLSTPTLSGIDKVTGLKIQASADVPTTNFSSDPSFKSGDDKVAN